ncbi:TIGR03545 family protein [candidate division KSB1 bacterium]|nr:TIGR03545 family protein [candidate division KSB1 bacterium]
MRWKGFIFLIILIAAIVVISIMFMDKWIERGLEKTAELAVGARVEIDGFHSSLLKLEFGWNRLQVTNPKSTMQNIVETGIVEFRLNMPALLRKRYVIEEMTVGDIRSGTERATDGALPKPPPKKKEVKTEPGAVDKAQAALTKEIDKLPVMNFDLDKIKRKLNLDSLIVMADLQIVTRLDSVKKDVTATSDKWQKFYTTFKPDDDLKRIQTEITSIDVNAIRDVPTLVATVDKVNKSRDELNTMYNQVQNTRKDITTDFDRVSQYTKSVDDWFKEDYQRILQKAKLPDLSVRNIGKILFGGTIVYQVDKYLNYIKVARKYLPKKSDKPKKEKPPRMAGQNIRFPDRYGYPTFLIQNIDINGQTGTTNEAPGIKLIGDVTGITNQPWVYGKPTQIELKGERENRPAGTLNGVLNHVTDTSKDSFHVELRNISLNNVAIHKSSYLPQKISKGQATINGTLSFRGDDLFANVDMVAKQLTFNFAESKPSDKFVATVQDVINGMDEITLNSTITGSGDNMDFRMDSNIDELVSKRLKAMGSQALKDTQQKIRARLEAIQKEKLNEANTIYQNKRKEYEDKIDTYRKQIEAEKQRLEEKLQALQKEIDDRKKAEADKAKDKAKDAINNLLKRP